MIIGRKACLHSLLIFFANCFVVSAQKGEKTRQMISSSMADTWVATDDLGRELLPAVQNGSIRKDKYVGIFYFVWHGGHGYDRHGGERVDEGVMDKSPTDTLSPYDISLLLKENPTAPKYGPVHSWHYWSEPYFGYYLPNDEWIIRKHAQMLSDGGVDVIILDVTNGAIYLPTVTKIVETYRKMRKEGRSTPSIAFIVNSAAAKTVERLYNSIYKVGLFKDLWFNWKGKPLLLCPPDALTLETRNFFSVRHSWAWSKGQEWFADGKDKWTWLDHTPQSYGWHDDKSKPEQISVAMAEHPVTNIGRSFHDGKQPEKQESDKGLYFAEQWKRALEVDPEFVFITGWNEWVAMRFNDGSAKEFLGKKIEKGETSFVDLFSPEYSRDAEPVKGKFNDNYYYQMVSNIRKFKGAREISVYKEVKKINMDGNFSDWNKVSASFIDDPGDTFYRDHPGWGRIKRYTDSTGRNDIVEAKVISDDTFVYFYVKTRESMTSIVPQNWMQLFIKPMGLKAPVWETFHFMVDGYKAATNSANLLQSQGGWNWKRVSGIDFKQVKNEMEIAVPKKALGINGDSFTIDFKWSDNSPINQNVMNWLDKGDTAPNARFAFRYIKE
jgi:hypothetical protein